MSTFTKPPAFAFSNPGELPEGVDPASVNRLAFTPAAIGNTPEDGGPIEVGGLANSGEISWHWFWGQFALDLKGAEAKPETWLLWAHDRENQIGKNSFELKEDGIFYKASVDPILADEKTMHLVRKKYPLEASVYFDPTDIEVVEEGKTAEVNGQTLQGPGHIIRKYTLPELSLCTIGHDRKSSVHRLTRSKGAIMPNPSPASQPDVNEELAKQLAAVQTEKAALAKRLEAIESEKRNSAVNALAETAGVDLSDEQKKAFGALSAEAITAIGGLISAVQAKSPKIPKSLSKSENDREKEMTKPGDEKSALGEYLARNYGQQEA